MVARSKEKRDLWIGHKLGNVITDVKIGGKQSLNEAMLIQHCKSILDRLIVYYVLAFHEGSVPLVCSDLHNFRKAEQELRGV